MAIVSGSKRQQTAIPLGIIIIKDLIRHMFFIILLIGIIGVSFYIVKQVKITRSNITSLNKEYKYQDELDQKFQHLRLQQLVLTEHYRVTEIAEKELHMKQSQLNEEKVINLSNRSGN
jgi:cell division protein FtsL